MTIVILDQFSGPSPYMLQQEPLVWEEFLAGVRGGLFASRWRPAQIVEADQVPALRMATTAYCRADDGTVMVAGDRWDSSG